MKTKAKPLPSRDLLNYLFRYDGKNLFWKNSLSKNKRWRIGKIAGSICPLGYYVVAFGADRRTYKVHRIIFKMKTGREPPEIDHDNRKRSDNTWSNLLESSTVKNAKNRSDSNHNLPHGVSYCKRGKKYRARGWNGGEIHLGVFNSKRAASNAYQNFVEQRRW